LVEAIADGTLAPGQRIRQEELGRALGVSRQPISHALRPDAPVLAFILADVAFHTALYRLSGNRAIEDTVAAQWPHLKRSMGAVLDDPEQRPLVWAEHQEILRLVLAGDAAGAERAARGHTDRAGGETARRLSQLSLLTGGDRDAADGAAASAVR
jgi:DNA-binding GntR family transcriptional regulator